MLDPLWGHLSPRLSADTVQPLDAVLQALDPAAYNYTGLSTVWTDFRRPDKNYLYVDQYRKLRTRTDLHKYMDEPEGVSGCCGCEQNRNRVMSRSCPLRATVLQNNVLANCCATFMVHRDRVKRNPRVMYEILLNASVSEVSVLSWSDASQFAHITTGFAFLFSNHFSTRCSAKT